MKMMVMWAISIYIDYLMMNFVAIHLGLAERIACVALMLLHLGLFLGYAYLTFRRNYHD